MKRVLHTPSGRLGLPRAARAWPASCADAGWCVVGADVSEHAVDSADFKTSRPTILVMGNEGYGLRTNCLNACTDLIQITQGHSSGDLQIVDSLNVSVATGIILHQLVATAGKHSSE
ncbi:hypothetical protein CYMTET_6368 [Cymbomonas tetramitiformis]|uniref:tRNA/rRNA methyltransferase SpoU type domain-containing protein n=1 Tax=Cymbomonas tetramitiformis TaxID=36881 RepID=A0AAE0LIH4_9CHLO|nr:hypothetical protein CYMTET_6368 [Cymbomonas tetramitiformis]